MTKCGECELVARHAREAVKTNVKGGLFELAVLHFFVDLSKS